MLIRKISGPVKLIIGLLLIGTVLWSYLPSVIENGMHEFELTFLSNSITGIIMIVGGIRELIRKKDLPIWLYVDSVVMLQIVFLICMAFIGEFNFSGGFMFLHVVNPILATLVILLWCKRSEPVRCWHVLGAVLFPLIYFIYVIIYGYTSGVWIYGILNIPQMGFAFVLGGIAGTGVILILLAWLQNRFGRHAAPEGSH